MLQLPEIPDDANVTSFCLRFLIQIELVTESIPFQDSITFTDIRLKHALPSAKVVANDSSASSSIVNSNHNGPKVKISVQ